MIPFTLLRLTETDQIAFVSGLTGSGVNDSNKIGLFATDINGNLGLIARSGDFLDVGNGELRQITQLRAESFNSSNQLGFLAFFTDGTNGAFIATVPEPAALLLTAALLAPLHRRRRS
jgi:MYXO-CTERM domain-containing protein